MSSTSVRQARTSKRPRLSAEAQPSGWSCPACTFLNPLSAFKCQICDTRKGTSTRNTSAVDTGALEIQRTIQQQIERRKRHPGRRSDSAAGNSDAVGHSSRRRTVANISDSEGEEEDESVDGSETWRMLGDPDESSSNHSSLSGGSSSAARNGSNRTNGSAKNGHRRISNRRLSPTPSPSPQPTSSSPAVSPRHSSPPNSGKKLYKNGIVKPEEVEPSSISSCSNSVASTSEQRKPSNGVLRRNQKNSPQTTHNGNSWKRNGQVSKKSPVTPRETSVTVRGITVVFTDYDPV